MAANGAVALSEAGRTPLLGAPNGEAVVLPPQDVSQATPDVAIDIPRPTPITVCFLVSPAGTDRDPEPSLAVVNPQNERRRPVCEVQINNLVDMQIKEGDAPLSERARKRLVALAALKEWTDSERGLQGKVDRRTKQKGKLIFEIYQLVGLYSVFVGVVFTAVLQSPLIKCQHIWVPVLLCVLAWLSIILITRKRLIKYNKLSKTLKEEDGARRALHGQISNLKSRGYEDFDFNLDVDERSREILPNSSTTTICGMQVTAPRVIPFVLTALTLILIGSFIHILCLQEISARL